jgi:hypothetical protein
MPIYEFQCPICRCVDEHYLTQSEAAGAFLNPLCTMCEDPTTMVRIVSMPAPPVIGGVERKIRQGEQLKKRSDDHFKSAAGQEEHRANVAAAHKRLGIP